ncbi:MAG: RNA polymerase factor sigma-54 [Deltaproteobacteria bacterium]|jgi:RNA polymerase sigma-54 factor|nr:RNA polymerase factor sigma-54 [Deltaproteobacteria bacterium]
MAMDFRLVQKQTQTMVMTPQLQLAIKLLQMNQLELQDEIYQEMLQNPVLEMSSPSDNAETGNTPDSLQETGPESGQEDQFAEVTGKTEEKIREEFDWENYLGEYSSSPSTSLGMGSHENPEETPGFETFTASRTSLSEHLLWQWRFVAVSREDYAIGETIIGNLTDDGYLAATLEEIAQMSGTSLTAAAEALERFQQLDPPGVAARDLTECLLLQLDRLGLKDSPASEICRHHTNLLEKKDLPGLCKAIQASRDQVLAAVEIIKSLDPRPARAFAQNDPIYVTPDVYITKVGDEYVISLNDDGMPRLRLNKAYQRMLAEKRVPDEATRQYLNEKLKGAVFLIRSIHQRQRTIYLVTESIFKKQKDFLEKGVDHLKPMVLKDVAEDLGFHESTISRVTANKYVDTPRGVFELKYFFDNPISRISGTDSALSSESVKNRIRKIISAEDPKKPLSDQRIVEILKGSNIAIARRTVAKYREILGFGPSSERRQMS